MTQSSVAADIATVPLFFDTPDGARLFGVWREAQPATNTGTVWVVCPPFAEEEKSAHRALAQVCEALCRRGDSSLFMQYRGTGDSAGDFATSTLAQWQLDIAAACNEARRRYPAQRLGVIGLRLGATLAALEANAVGADCLVLLEPILQGRQVLSAMSQRKRLRAMMTQHEGQVAAESQTALSSAPAEPTDDIEDFDGWGVGAALRADLQALDLMVQMPAFAGSTLLLQIGPRAEIAAGLQKLLARLQEPSASAAAQAIVMQPFWNLLDYVYPDALIQTLLGADLGLAARTDRRESVTTYDANRPASPPDASGTERAVAFENVAGQQLIGVYHEAAGAATAVITLHGWTGYRTGPHQMLTRAAREFAAAGCSVLRFDFAGRGDSGGDTEVATLATMADDTHAAISWCREAGHSRVVLLGLCSGCEVAVAAAAEEGVQGLALWSAPVFAAVASDARTSRKRLHHLKAYARKLLRPATYAKIVTGRLDKKAIRQVVTQGGGGEARNVESGEPGHLPPGWRAAALRGFEGVRYPQLWIYGTADPTTAEALAWYRQHAAVPATVHLVEGANHSYYSLAWEREVIAHTKAWLAELVQ
jgi:alpha/beta superfamily hydrolase